MEKVLNIRASSLTEFKRFLGVWFWVAISTAVVLDVSLLSLLGLDVVTRGLSQDRSGLFFLMALPWILLLIGFALVAQTVRNTFWKHFAQDRGWTYESRMDPTSERALMFHSGHSHAISNAVSGMLDGRHARVFEHSFAKGHGKQRQHYNYTVFEFSFAGTFPHMYLNYTGDWYDVEQGSPLAIPGLPDSLRLFAPHQYEVEAFEIFTPDVLEKLRSLQWEQDAELVDKKLMVFSKYQVDSRDELEKGFATAKLLADVLGPSLDRVNFHEIGDHPSVLS